MNEIIQPLRFYTSTTLQIKNRHTKLGFNNIVPLVADRSHLLPFCLYNSKSNSTESEITVCSLIRSDGLTYNILSRMTFEFYWDDLVNPTKQFIYYDGGSTLLNIRFGIYYLHISDGTNNWYSDYFKIGIYDTCLIEYSNTYSFGNLVMPSGKFYKAYFRSYTYDQGESLEFSEVNKDEDNYDIPTYQRFDDIRTCLILGDSTTKQFLKILPMMDTIYITDELGVRSLIKVTGVDPSSISKGNYLSLALKYYIVENSIISVVKTPSSLKNRQIGADFEADVDGITFNGETITFNGEPVKFNQWKRY